MFRSVCNAFGSLAALVVAACQTPMLDLPHRRAMDAIAELEQLGSADLDELDRGLQLALEILLDDPRAPALARHRCVERVGAWAAELAPRLESRSELEIEQASPDADRRFRSCETLLREDLAERLRSADREDANADDAQLLRHLAPAVELGRLTGGSSTAMIRALSFASALHAQTEPGALRTELERTGFILAARLSQRLLAEALSERDPSPAVRAALVASWRGATRDAGLGFLFACAGDDASEEVRRALIAAACKSNVRALSARGIDAWLVQRARDESSMTSRLATRALRALGLGAFADGPSRARTPSRLESGLSYVARA